MMINQLFHVKNVCKNVKNQHISNFWFIRFVILPNCIRNHHTEFEINGTI